MLVKDIAMMSVFGLLVYMGGIGCGVAMLEMYELSGLEETLTIVHCSLNGIHLLITGALIVGQPSGLQSKIRALVVFLFLGAAVGIIAGGSAIAHADAFTYWKPERSASTYSIVVSLTLAFVELVLIFVYIRANESLSAMSGTDEFPTAPLSTYVCGNQPEFDDNSDDPEVEDPDYGRKRKKQSEKPSFHNKKFSARDESFSPSSSSFSSEDDSDATYQEHEAVRGRLIKH
jgi:hypothetical protein